MGILLILLVTAGLALSGYPLGAAFVWCVAIAIRHALEETRGELWIYFARRAEAWWLATAGPLGFLLIVLPALLLQGLAAWLAFMRGELDPKWLAVVIGLRVGDALFSHVIPFATDREVNPGLPSAVIYLVDGLLLALLWHVPLMAVPRQAISGFVLGVSFFAAVLPGLRFTRGFLPALVAVACISLPSCHRTPGFFDPATPPSGQTARPDESDPMGLGNSGQ